MVEDSSFTVDRLVSAFPALDHLVRYGGHYFSNQPPGLALIVAAMYRAAAALGSDPSWASTAAALATAAAGALLGPVIYSTSRRLGGGPRSSLAAALLAVLGNLAGVYAGSAFPHSLAALLLGLSLALLLRDGSLSGLWAGIPAACAAVTDFHVFPVALSAAVVLAFFKGRRRQAVGFALPLLISGAAMAVFNWYLFGAPWRFPWLLQSVSGAVPSYSYPSALSLLHLMFGSGGLMVVSPWLALALPGWLRLWREDRAKALTMGVPIAAGLLILASFSRADGDVTDDARRAIILISMLASLVPVGLEWASERLAGRLLWPGVIMLAGYSVAYAASLRLRLMTLAPAEPTWPTSWVPLALLAACGLLVGTISLVAGKSRSIKGVLVPASTAVFLGLVAILTLLPVAIARAEALSSPVGENLLGNSDFSVRDPRSGWPVGWEGSGGVQGLARTGGVQMAPGAALTSPLIEVRSTNPLMVELGVAGGPVQLTFQWEDLAHRTLERDTYIVSYSTQRTSASAPPGATGVKLEIKATGDTLLSHVRVWEAGIRVEPFPDYYRAALAFSFDWETAMGGAIHSRGDPNHDVAGAVGAGLKMREGARWLGDLLAQRHVSATFFATGYNLLFGNRERQQFVGNPTYKWASRKNGWASDYWTTHPWYSDDPYTDYATDPAWYFGDLTLYLRGLGHDIQTHTFGHLYVRGTKPEELDADLREWNRVAAQLGLAPAVTFSFPWTSSNSVGAAHYRVLVQNGIRYVTRTYDNPHPYELRALPDAPELVFLPDQQLEANPDSLSRALLSMEEAVIRRGYLSLWSHPEDAADPQGKYVWSAAVERALHLRGSGDLWIENVTTLLEYGRALRGLSVATSRWGSTWRATLTYDGDRVLNGVTLALPGNVWRATVDGQPWTDFRDSRLRLPYLQPGTTLQLVAELK